MEHTITLPNSWRWAKIADIALTSSGGTPLRSRSKYFGGDIPWLKSGELRDQVINTTEETITKLGLEKSSAKWFPKGTVVVALYGATIGKTGILNFDTSTNQAVCAILPINNSFISKFMFYWLQSKRKHLISLSMGGAQPNISQGIIKSLDFPLAPIPDQEKIAAKIEELFSQLDAGISGLKRIQALLKHYRASVLKAAFEGRLAPQDPHDEPAGEMLRRFGKKPLERGDLPSLPDGWAWTIISDIAGINERHPKLRDLPDDFQVTFVPMAAVDAYSGVISNPEVKNLGEVRKGYTSFIEQDVLFAKITPCMQNGKAAIARKLINGIGFGSTEFHVIRPNKSVIPEWLYFYIRQESFRNGAEAHFSGTAGQMRVPKSFLEDHPLPLPPLNEQSRAVAELERQISVIEEIERQAIKSLQHSKILRQVVLKSAFEGQLI